MKVCEKCGAKNFDASIICDNCETPFTDAKKKCPVCDALNDAGSLSCRECGSTLLPVKSKGNAESGIKIVWPTVKIVGNDTRFTLPETASSILLYYQVISWIVTIVVAVVGVRSYWGAGALTIFGFVGGCVATLAVNLLVARIVYEIVVVLFEQLKVMRQIRDLLLQKMK